MLRQRLNDELKAAMKSRDQRATSTLRLILAALKDRDIAARPRGVTDGVDETEIIDMLTYSPATTGYSCATAGAARRRPMTTARILRMQAPL